MSKSVLVAAAGLLFFLSAPLAATEVDRPLPAAEVVPAAAAPDVPVAGELQLTEVRLEERAAADDAALAQPARGSFWWAVGVLVIAGVILAVVL